MLLRETFLSARLKLSLLLATAALCLPGLAAGQATDVLTDPGDGELKLSFTPSASGVAHDVYIAAERGVTSSNFVTLEGGRSVLNVASPVNIRGLDNNREYFIIVVEHDASGATSSSVEVVGAPRGSWMVVNDEAAFVSLAVDAQTDGLIIAAGVALAGGCQVTPKPLGCDVYRSTDGGSTWAVVTSDLPDLDPAAVVIDNGIGLAATRNVLTPGAKILRSSDDGLTWGLSAEGTVAVPNDKTFIFDPGQANTVLSGNFDFGRGALSTIVRSVDSGQTWNHLPDLVTPSALNARAIAVDPASSMVIWLGGAGSPRLARSTNGGNTWSEVVITVVGAVQDIVFDSLVPSKIWLADDTQVYGSLNGGAVFMPRTTGLEDGTLIRSLERDPVAEILYVNTSTGVYESRDDGQTFAKVGVNLDGEVRSLAISTEPPALIAATPTGLARLDLTPPGPIAAPADAGVDAGGGDLGDSGCGCQNSPGSDSGGTFVLLLIAMLLVGRGSAGRDGRRLARRFRESPRRRTA